MRHKPYPTMMGLIVGGLKKWLHRPEQLNLVHCYIVVGHG